jgi:hypothetical protein
MSWSPRVARSRCATKDGEKRVVVPEKAPIITYAPATAAMLTPGAHVIITATRQPDGSPVAQRVGVGKDGLVPPMKGGPARHGRSAARPPSADGALPRSV